MNYKCGGKRSATPLWLPRQPGLDKPKRRRRYALPAHSITAPTWQDFGVRCANAVRGGLSQRDRAGVRGKDTHDSERGSGQFHADPEPAAGQEVWVTERSSQNKESGSSKAALFSSSLFLLFYILQLRIK